MLKLCFTMLAFVYFAKSAVESFWTCQLPRWPGRAAGVRTKNSLNSFFCFENGPVNVPSFSFWSNNPEIGAISCALGVSLVSRFSTFSFGNIGILCWIKPQNDIVSGAFCAENSTSSPPRLPCVEQWRGLSVPWIPCRKPLRWKPQLFEIHRFHFLRRSFSAWALLASSELFAAPVELRNVNSTQWLI